jgi:hypothetical protein
MLHDNDNAADAILIALGCHAEPQTDTEVAKLLEWEREKVIETFVILAERGWIELSGKLTPEGARACEQIKL